MRNGAVIIRLVGFVVAVGMAALAWEVVSVTEPYLVRPVDSATAPEGARVGYSIAPESRVLSVVSGSEATVVADPGSSFRHEVVWLVEEPRPNGSSELREFTCVMPEYATEASIRPLGTPVPAKIRQVADGSRWSSGSAKRLGR